MTVSKKSTLRSLRDFDPEIEDFGSEISRNNKKGASLQHGHLGDIKTTGSLAEGFENKKYAGKSVSRKDLVSEEDEEDSEDYSDAMSDMNSEDYSDMSENSEDYSENDSELDSEDYSDDSDMSESEIRVDSKLSAQMRELEMEDDQSAFELITQARPAAVDDQQKSQHVRNQLVKFDDYVDIRFKLQPLLNSVNRFPAKKTKNAQVQEALNDVVGELEGSMRDLLDLSATELKGDAIEIPQDANPKREPSQMQKYWDDLTRLDAAIDPFARSALQTWHNKMTLSSDLKAKKTLRMLNQDPYQQVQIALQDEERLVARTRVYRDSSKKRLGFDNQEMREFDDIYDDNDFYQVLLKDWTASHGALSSSTASAMSAILVPAKKQHRANVDQRASKGRKIRYDVHAKLVNYMVPQIEKGAWTDTKIDEFYASLLGQSVKN